MATIKNFEELEIWQRAIEIYRMVCRLVRQPEFADEKRLKEQMRSSAGSVADNIAEGFERASQWSFHIPFLLPKARQESLGPNYIAAG
ncbi:MAG: four helix bundle protein [Flavihumibacter sp.]